MHSQEHSSPTATPFFKPASTERPSSGKVLVVDDEDVICSTLRIYLESEGFAVQTVNSGRKALAELESGAYEVLILDILMPQMNGLEVMGWIQDHGLPTEVIVTTGAGSHDVGVEAMRLGAFELLRKPILNFDETLLISVRQAVERYRLKADLREKGERAQRLDRCLNELYQLGLRILRTTDDASLLELLAEGIGTLVGDATFLFYRAGPDGTFLPVGRDDVAPITFAQAPQSPFNHPREAEPTAAELPLEPHVGLFPLTVREKPVGLLALGGLKQKHSTDLLPLLSLLPAVGCYLLARTGDA